MHKNATFLATKLQNFLGSCQTSSLVQRGRPLPHTLPPRRLWRPPWCLRPLGSRCLQHQSGLDAFGISTWPPPPLWNLKYATVYAACNCTKSFGAAFVKLLWALVKQKTMRWCAVDACCVQWNACSLWNVLNFFLHFIICLSQDVILAYRIYSLYDESWTVKKNWGSGHVFSGVRACCLTPLLNISSPHPFDAWYILFLCLQLCHICWHRWRTWTHLKTRMWHLLLWQLVNHSPL